MTQKQLVTICSLVAMLSLLGGRLCGAQECATDTTSTKFDCIYQTCKSSVVVETPVDNGGGNQQHVSCDSVPCCKQFFSDCYLDGQECRFVRVHSPAVREALNDLANTSRVMVADCRGRYALYEPDEPPLGRIGAHGFSYLRD